MFFRAQKTIKLAFNFEKNQLSKLNVNKKISALLF